MPTQLKLPVLGKGLHPAKAAVLARRITPDWRTDAACADAKDPDAWFPDPSTLAPDLAEALAVCVACPVRRSCLAAALLGNETGIWAGTTRDDRRHGLLRLSTGAATDLVLDELLYKARTRAKETT